MERINNEYYVSFEVAKLLKDLDFNWECRCYYETSGKLRGKNSGNFTVNYNSPLIWQNNGNTDTQLYSAPTLDVAQRWLREVGNKNGTVILTLNFNENISKHWEVKGIHLNKDRTVMHWFYTCHVKPYGRGIIPVDCWDTYEDAQEAGIKKALEIILANGE